MTINGPAISWLPPDGGAEIPLSLAGLDPSGYIATQGVRGLGLPTIAITADDMPRGGTRIRHQQPQPRSFTLPIYIEGTGNDEAARAATFITRWRALAESIESTRRKGPGQIVVARPDGSRRLLDATYETGFDNEPDGGAFWDLATPTFYCPDPYWRAAELTLITRVFGVSGGVSFLSPLITITSSQVLGASTANNPGPVEAWPQWRIVGPASTVTATNSTTGESWIFDAVTWRGTALAAGEEVTITTEPAVVLGPASGPQGTNWAGALNWPNAVLWGLEPGDNDIDIAVGGSAAGSIVEASFYARYGTA